MIKPLASLFISLATACSAPGHPVEPVPAAPAATAAPTPAAPNVPEPSIYDLELRLRDANNHDVGLDIQRGHPVLITMFYASCPVACPVLIDELGRIASELPPAVQADLRIVLVSFDPRDTPAVLSELAATRKLDARWTLAGASEIDARTLAAVLGFKYRKLANGDYFHGATIVALDADGQPIARAEKMGQRETLFAAFR